MKRASDTGSTDKLLDALNSFRCCKDGEIESFLHSDAIVFVSRGWCAVYLILDENGFENGKMDILAYFTLSHKSLIPAFASNTSIRRAGGFSKSKSIQFVLIGQLGKYMDITSDGVASSADISAKEIIAYALEIIRAVDTYIPCGCVLVECGESEKVMQVYKKCHFKFLQHDGRHNQLFRKIGRYKDE